MLIKEAIILAGGLGTRLRSAVPDLPKCMAPVAGKPFLSHLINYLLDQGIEKFIFSLGYKSEDIEQFLIEYYPGLTYQLVIEESPLGTGGAIKRACSNATDNSVLIFNGDTFFKVDLMAMSRFHHFCAAHCTLALKPMQDFSRYGAVELHGDYRIKSFREKNHFAEGLINGGVYALNVGKFLGENLPEKFSFEKEYLQHLFAERRMYGFIQDSYFIDIGIPEDFQKAQNDFENSEF